MGQTSFIVHTQKQRKFMMQGIRFSRTHLFGWLLIFCPIFILAACAFAPENPMKGGEVPTIIGADVISVEVTGDTNAYQFSVGIRSPDTGCEQYADWWEVISENGALIYRRILTHSHVNEQPFVRSGGPAPIGANEVVYVRAHMHPTGYGGTVFVGSVRNGFQEVTVSSDFAVEVERESPQPNDCAA
jgi:hypothetical protein